MQRQCISRVSYSPCRWVALRMLDPARTVRQSTTLPVDRRRWTGSASTVSLPSVHRLLSESGTGNKRRRDHRGSRRVQSASWRTRCPTATFASVAYLAERCTQCEKTYNNTNKSVSQHRRLARHYNVIVSTTCQFIYQLYFSSNTLTKTDRWRQKNYLGCKDKN